MFFIPHMSVVFHVKLLNILGFFLLPEKILDKYFEIKGALAIFRMVVWGVKPLSDFELPNSITKG